MIKISCTKANATLLATEVLTSGSEGRICDFEFNEDWDGLAKVAVVKAGSYEQPLTIIGNQITIPAEAFESPRVNLIIGVRGTDATTVIIPTIWCAVGLIAEGTDYEGSPGTGTVTPTLVDQIVAAMQTALINSVIDAEAEIDQGVHSSTNPATVTVERIVTEDEGEEGTTLKFSFSNLIGAKGSYADITGQVAEHIYGDTPSINASGLSSVILTIDFPDAESIPYDDSYDHVAGSIAEALAAAQEQIFVASYGTTTYDAISAAYNAGAEVLCIKDAQSACLYEVTAQAATFTTSKGNVNTSLVCSSETDAWTTTTTTLENTANKVTAWSATTTNTNYPSEKLVKDSIDAVSDSVGSETTARENAINALETQLTTYVDTNFGNKLALSLNTTTYILTISILNDDGETLDSKTVDFPIESVVVNGRYDSANKALVLVLKNGTEISVPVDDLISGLATEAYVDSAVGEVDANLTAHTSNTSNPHSVTKAQVGLGNVDNTSDLDKPISTATQAALDDIDDELSSQSSSIDTLDANVKSTAQTKAEYHMGFYRDADGDLCEA